MAKCIPCRKPNLDETAPDYPMEQCIELYEIFEDIWYCAECCEKFNLPVPARSVPVFDTY
jgi:hypothetical protein